MQQCGLRPLADKAEAPAAAVVRARKATLHALWQSGEDDQ
jgi:hypothetical protein